MATFVPASGGGGEPFPDSHVTGTGAYVIPIGFNGLVRVCCDPENPVTLNGTNVLSHRLPGPSLIEQSGTGLQNLLLEDGFWKVMAQGYSANPQIATSIDCRSRISNPVGPNAGYNGMISNLNVNTVDTSNTKAPATVSTDQTQFGYYFDVVGRIDFAISGSTRHEIRAVRQDYGAIVSHWFKCLEGDTVNGGLSRSIELYPN